MIKSTPSEAAPSPPAPPAAKSPAPATPGSKLESLVKKREDLEKIVKDKEKLSADAEASLKQANDLLRDALVKQSAAYNALQSATPETKAQAQSDFAATQTAMVSANTAQKSAQSLRDQTAADLKKAKEDLVAFDKKLETV